jgi:hypothetical protein
MVPELYNIRYAAGADELLAALGKFVSYVKTGPVCSLLPQGLQDISARDAAEIAQWEHRIDSILHDTLPINASARFWLSEINEVLKAARYRLDELMQSKTASGETLH